MVSETGSYGTAPPSGTAPVVDRSPGVDGSVAAGPFSCIDPSASVGIDTRVEERVSIGPGVVIGARCRVSAGAVLRTRVVVGDDVVIGPNAVFVDSDAAGAGHAATIVREGASIGANVTVLPGVVIGSNATVGAGAVVTGDVPPNATVVGSPARIVGYRSSSPETAASRFRASSVDDAAFPVAIGRASLMRYPQIDDLRGSLSFGEVPTHLPFAPRRYFLVFDVPSREVRGEHAHRRLHQLLVCVRGECAVAVDDGETRGEVMLDEPRTALHLPPMVWGTQYRYSPDAVLLVLASDGYDEADYIRDYDEFLREIRNG